MRIAIKDLLELIESFDNTSFALAEFLPEQVNLLANLARKTWTNPDENKTRLLNKIASVNSGKIPSHRQLFTRDEISALTELLKKNDQESLSEKLVANIPEDDAPELFPPHCFQKLYLIAKNPKITRISKGEVTACFSADITSKPAVRLFLGELDDLAMKTGNIPSLYLIRNRLTTGRELQTFYNFYKKLLHNQAIGSAMLERVQPDKAKLVKTLIGLGYTDISSHQTQILHILNMKGEPLNPFRHYSQDEYLLLISRLKQLTPERTFKNSKEVGLIDFLCSKVGDAENFKKKTSLALANFSPEDVSLLAKLARETWTNPDEDEITLLNKIASVERGEIGRNKQVFTQDETRLLRALFNTLNETDLQTKLVVLAPKNEHRTIELPHHTHKIFEELLDKAGAKETHNRLWPNDSLEALYNSLYYSSNPNFKSQLKLYYLAVILSRDPKKLIEVLTKEVKSSTLPPPDSTILEMLKLAEPRDYETLLCNFHHLKYIATESTSQYELQIKINFLLELNKICYENREKLMETMRDSLQFFIDNGYTISHLEMMILENIVFISRRSSGGFNSISDIMLCLIASSLVAPNHLEGFALANFSAKELELLGSLAEKKWGPCEVKTILLQKIKSAIQGEIRCDKQAFTANEVSDLTDLLNEKDQKTLSAKLLHMQVMTDHILSQKLRGKNLLLRLINERKLLDHDEESFKNAFNEQPANIEKLTAAKKEAFFQPAPLQQRPQPTSFRDGIGAHNRYEA